MRDVTIVFDLDGTLVDTAPDLIDATNHAYWTPALNANGTLNAFEVVAQDNLGAESIG